MSSQMRTDFAADAEQLRLNGNAVAAIEVAEAGLVRTPDDLKGRIALALARIDLGDVLQARDELAAVLAPSRATPRPTSAAALEARAPVDSAAGFDLDGEVEDDELETAFALAESDPDEMMDANRVVEQTLRAAELDAPEADFDLTSHPTYATESMAMLLDEQGRRAEAAALREVLAERRNTQASPSLEEPDLELASDSDLAPAWGAAGLGPDHARQLHVVATLEGWLHNLKRNGNKNTRAQGRGAAGGAA